jgi:hypothetical protein
MAWIFSGAGDNPLPELRMQVQPGETLAIRITGPQADVAGFSIRLPVEHVPSQEDAVALSGRFQTLYDALPEAQKMLMAALVGQAAEYAGQVWSGDAESE